MLIGTPEEKAARQKLWCFVAENVTRNNINIEVWARGLDDFKLYVTTYLFPNLTLRTFDSLEFIRMNDPKLVGEEGIFKEQGYLEILQGSFYRYFIWGLTRRGDWVLGQFDGGAGNPFREVCLAKCSSRDVIVACLSFTGGRIDGSVAFITEQIKCMISLDLLEKRRRQSEIERVFGSIETFSGVIAAKAGIPIS